MLNWRTATTLFLALAGFALFAALGISREVYHATIPRSVDPFALVLRKAYSLVAFACVGYLYAWAVGRFGRITSRLETASAIALFSGLIEVVQDARGSTEGLRWNLYDIAFGAAGGLLGAELAALARRSGSPR
ncbi:MAG: hypothetical protein ACLPYS_03355 [Vulcanimicrobiaceae bacterium]